MSSEISKADKELYGTIWFYSGDTPYLYFIINSVKFFINFNVCYYHTPINDKIITNPIYYKDDEEHEEYIKKLYSPSMKNTRIWIFEDNNRNVTGKLILSYHCDHYNLDYGVTGPITSVYIPDSEVENVVNALDKMFEDGVKNAYGDFIKGENTVIKTGISSTISCESITWRYEMTIHKHISSDHKYCIGKAITVTDKTTTVSCIKGSESIAPWQCCVANLAVK